MNILITGGNGFIGTNFILYILNKNTENKIYNIDCLNYCSNHLNIVHEKYKFIQGNITNKEFILYILAEYNIDAIIHFAAQSHVDNSFDNSLQYTQDNVYGTHVLLQASKEYGKLRKFLHFSTDEVYGEVDLDHPGCHEKSLLNPTNPYAATKAAAEFLVHSYYHSFKLPVVIIRCNNVYGLHQYPEKLIPKFIKLLKEGKKLTIHGNGETRRNFIWAEDVARATELIFNKGGINEIYNIGTTQEYSVMDIARILVNKLTTDKILNNHIEYVTDRPFNDSRYCVDTTKLKNLGWSEEFTDFDKNIDKIINYV
jgi:dTDP-glucose 4,6-dehydratase